MSIRATLKHFIVDPLRYHHPGLAIIRLAMLLQERTNGKTDALYTRWAKLVSPVQKLPEPEWLDTKTIDNVVSALNQDGCCVLPVQLSQEEIAEIRDFAFSNPAYAKKIGEHIDIRADAIPTDQGRYMWPMQALLKLKTVQRLMKESSLHQIAQSYLGAQCIVISITLWIDPPFDKGYSAHIYHYDNDGPRFLKYFFYITDVGTDTGAHRYIRGTHPHTKPDQFRISKRYEEKLLLDYFGSEKEIIFTAPAGTIIAEDTAGFHRGSTIKRNYRLLMQIEYGLLDSPLQEELEKRIEPEPLPGLDHRLARIVRKFFRPL